MSKPAGSLLLSTAAWAAKILPAGVKRRIYQIGPLAHWLRGGLNRAAPRGLSVVAVASGLLEGKRLLLDMQTEKDYWLGTYEPELQAALPELVSPGMLAYDVGANIGYISLMLANLVGPAGKVFAFEALPDNVARLRQNLALNELSGPMIVVPQAVVDQAGPVSFLVGPSGGMGKAAGSAGRQEVSYSQEIKVQGVSLDDFVFQAGNPVPQFIKIDIEGGEVLALPGMARLLREARPIMVLELHGPQAAQAAWDHLRGSSYRICRLAGGFPEITTLDQMDWKAYIVGLP